MSIIEVGNTPEVTLEFVTPQAEKLIGQFARVSNPKNQSNPHVSNLIKYCVKHAHWSIFEHAHMTLKVTTTLDIATQVLRHRSFTFQQLSRRYAGESEAPVAIHQPHLRAPHPTNRQKSVDALDPKAQEYFAKKLEKHFTEGLYLYKEMLAAGVAKECARAILPQATQTTMYMTGNARSWLHYIALRRANGTQEEHRQIALAAEEIFKVHFPSTYQAAKDLDWRL